MNPEDHVLDVIDALVDEQLAAGIHDDYNANYYPRCPGCRHEWHGIACECCGCPSSEGEAVADQVTVRTRRDINYFSIEDRPWVFYHPERDEIEVGNLPRGEPRGYTIADLEAMRTPYIQNPRVRFRWLNELHNTWHVLEGEAQIMHVELNGNGITVWLRLNPFHEQVIDSGPVVVIPGMITMDSTTSNGYEPIAYLRPENFTREHSGGRCDVTIRVSQDIARPVMEQLAIEFGRNR